MPTMAIPETIGQRVRRLRETKGLTQQDLAQAAELALSNVAQIERGKIADPRASTLQALAKALGVKVGDLFPAEENGPS